MAWSKKKRDPLSARSRELNDEIARLEAEIKRLDSRARAAEAELPALPATPAPNPRPPATVPAAPAHIPAALRSDDPIFEETDKNRLQAHGEATPEGDIYNELGVRKYDLPALWRRLASHFRGPSTTNPKLVSYLAAGGIQGLRPLRYEKRVARNRFILLVAAIFLLLLGVIYEFAAHNR